MTQYAADCMEYEVFFEGEHGMESTYIQATTPTDMIKQLKASYPDDHGADGFYNCPRTGEEKPLTW